jgi:hypothetical protein
VSPCRTCVAVGGQERSSGLLDDIEFNSLFQLSFSHIRHWFQFPNRSSSLFNLLVHVFELLTEPRLEPQRPLCQPPHLTPRSAAAPGLAWRSTSSTYASTRTASRMVYRITGDELSPYLPAWPIGCVMAHLLTTRRPV